MGKQHLTRPKTYIITKFSEDRVPNPILSKFSEDRGPQKPVLTKLNSEDISSLKLFSAFSSLKVCPGDKPGLSRGHSRGVPRATGPKSLCLCAFSLPETLGGEKLLDKIGFSGRG